MLIEFPYGRGYLMTALEGAPDLFDHLLAGLTTSEADLRPDPERFTIREVMAHIAEWETVFLARMKRICSEETPVLEGYDEWQWATEHNYAGSNPLEQSKHFRERRTQTVAFLHSRSPADWLRSGNRPEIGLITLEAQALLISLHDTYHLRQITEWRRMTAPPLDTP